MNNCCFAFFFKHPTEELQELRRREKSRHEAALKRLAEAQQRFNMCLGESGAKWEKNATKNPRCFFWGFNICWYEFSLNNILEDWRWENLDVDGFCFWPLFVVILYYWICGRRGNGWFGSYFDEEQHRKATWHPKKIQRVRGINTQTFWTHSEIWWYIMKYHDIMIYDSDWWCIMEYHEILLMIYHEISSDVHFHIDDISPTLEESTSSGKRLRLRHACSSCSNSLSAGKFCRFGTQEFVMFSTYWQGIEPLHIFLVMFALFLWDCTMFQQCPSRTSLFPKQDRLYDTGVCTMHVCTHHIYVYIYIHVDMHRISFLNVK